MLPEDLRYVGVSDHDAPLFENQFPLPCGMAYNAYVLRDEKTAVFDAVEAGGVDAWLNNVAQALDGRQPDYLIISHMEPDHSAGLAAFLNQYPEVTVAATAKALQMLSAFYDVNPEKRLVVKDGDALSLGRHTLTFLTAPMVHWPEVMFTFDALDGTLFSADAFGAFGANDGAASVDEARRYYFAIVAKYGAQVQAALNKVAGLPIRRICSLHGPVEQTDVAEKLRLYKVWASYAPEGKGVVIAYTTVYGHTKAAAEALYEKLKAESKAPVALYDLVHDDWSQAVADAFRYDKLVLATTTYNMGFFPPMRQFIDHLAERGFRSRTVGLIENGSWAPAAEKGMRAALDMCKDLTFCDQSVHILSALNLDSRRELEKLAGALRG